MLMIKIATWERILRRVRSLNVEKQVANLYRHRAERAFALLYLKAKISFR